jgi:hypothetical protein
MAIAAAYGMIHPDAADSSTVRATFVIDPDGLIRAMVWYPMSTGRSVEEILRLVEALQTSCSPGLRAGAFFVWFGATAALPILFERQKNEKFCRK